MAATTTSRTGSYLLGAEDAERARLLAQGELYRAETEALFTRLGVGPGWRCLDVGCGPLGVLDIMARRVGPTGHVVGIEQEPRMLRMAETTLAERGVGGVALVEGDAATNELESGSFDLVHERLLLVNVERPEAIVAEMVRLARSGGYVTVRDFDVLSWICQPPHPAWERLFEALDRVWVGDLFVGRRLPGLLRAAGLDDLGMAATGVRTCQPRENAFHKVLLRFVDVYRTRILADGRLTETDLDASIRGLDTHLDHPDTFSLSPVLVEAWGRKP